jgi:hypothetical protein
MPAILFRSDNDDLHAVVAQDKYHFEAATPATHGTIGIMTTTKDRIGSATTYASEGRGNQRNDTRFCQSLGWRVRIESEQVVVLS